MSVENASARPALARHEPQELELGSLLVFLLAGAFPVGFAFASGVLVGVLAIAVAVAAAIAGHVMTRDPFVVFFGAVLAPLFVTGLEVGLLALLGAVALALAAATRFPLAIILTAVGIALPDGTGMPLAAMGAAGVVAGTSYVRQVPFGVGLVLAFGIAILGGVVHQAWVLMALGLAGGILVRYALRHPGFPHLGPVADRVAPWAAVFPALLLFGLAAIGKEPQVAPLRMLAVAWGAVGLGVLVGLAVYGVLPLVRASDPGVPLWLAFFPSAVFVVPATALLADLDTAARGASVVWVLFALPAALGAHRLWRSRDARRWIVVAGLAVAVAVASGLRLWLD